MAAAYAEGCSAHLDNKLRTRADSASRVATLMAFFGERLDVRSLTADDQRRYASARTGGGIVVAGRPTKPVRARSVQADLFVLHHMLSWACTVPTPNGGRWLARNPLAGVKREREKNPRGPVATWDRFIATRTAIQKLAASAEADVVKSRWRKIELALVIAEATGRRLGAIRELRWDDIDFARRRITWRAEADKKGIEWVVPMPDELMSELLAFKTTSSESPLLFPSDGDCARPMDRHLFDKWLVVAEGVAGLEKLIGSTWHAYRRKWASERRHHSIVDVAAAGGWKDRATLLEAYQQPDEQAIYAVMAEPRKRREPTAA